MKGVCAFTDNGINGEVYSAGEPRERERERERKRNRKKKERGREKIKI